MNGLRVGRFTRQQVLSQTWKWILCLGYETRNGEYQVEFVGRRVDTNFQHSSFQDVRNITGVQNEHYDLLNILEEFKTWRNVFKWEEYCLNRLQLFFDLLSMYPPTLENMRRIYSIFPEKVELSLCVSKIPRHEKIYPFTIIVSKMIDKVYRWLEENLISPLNVESVQDYRKITVFTDCIIMKDSTLFYEEHQMLPLHIPRVLILNSLSKIKVQKYTKVYNFTSAKV